jgi:hypothetical protein
MRRSCSTLALHTSFMGEQQGRNIPPDGRLDDGVGLLSAHCLAVLRSARVVCTREVGCAEGGDLIVRRVANTVRYY